MFSTTTTISTSTSTYSNNNMIDMLIFSQSSKNLISNCGGWLIGIGFTNNNGQILIVWKLRFYSINLLCVTNNCDLFWNQWRTNEFGFSKKKNQFFTTRAPSFKKLKAAPCPIAPIPTKITFFPDSQIEKEKQHVNNKIIRVKKFNSF